MTKNQGTELPGMDESDKLTLDGTLNREDERIITLTTSEKTWNVMIPPEKLEELSIEESITVTVEGFSMPSPPDSDSSTGNFLMATAIIIDGERYEIEGGRPEKKSG